MKILLMILVLLGLVGVAYIGTLISAYFYDQEKKED
jgi:hypothetical protein